MKTPILITRTIKVFETKKNKQLVSTTFIAKFEDKTEKFLNQKKWEQIGLLKNTDIEYQILDKNECSLYFKDWSKNPTFGTMQSNYPPSILPNEILNLVR